jgi:hypothetical protein
MGANNLKYKFQENKSKIGFAFAVIILLIAIFLAFRYFGIGFDYGTKDINVKEKTVLATGIVGGNNTGKVDLYNPENGEIMDTINLEGEVFIYDKGSDMSAASAYDPNNSKLYEIKVKAKKLSTSEKTVGISEDYLVINYDYENNHFVGLLEDELTFIYKNVSSKNEEKVIDLELEEKIDSYLIVKNNLLVISGFNIYSYDLSKDESVSIYMGESSLSIVTFKNKTYIHNNFGYERNKSILLDIDPATLYINNVYQFKDSKANMIEGSSDSEIIYFSEELINTAETTVTQYLKYMGEDMGTSRNIMKHTAIYPVSRLNAYGNKGYIYYLEDTKLITINSKDAQIEFEYEIDSDFFMPIY